MKRVFAALCLWSFGACGYQFDDAVPQSVRDQITQDLEFMASIEGSETSRLHQEIFGEVGGANYKKFFESRVTDIGLHGCGSANAVACVIPFLGHTRIWLTENYTKFSHPQIAKMMIVFHEARHTEKQNGYWSHADCPTPFVDKNGQEIKSIWTGATLAGEPACDETPFGSYGSSMILLKNVSKFCSNCTEKVRSDAGLYADDQYKRITDEDARNEIWTDLYDDEV